MFKGLRATFLLLTVPACIVAQTAAVPNSYQDLYSSLQGQLDKFYATVSAGWNGSQPNVDFSGALLTANANRGTEMLAPGAFDGVQMELRQLQARGLKAVTLSIGFPILSQDFLKFNGDPEDYQGFLGFYQQVSQQAHSMGLKVIVESGILFTGAYSANSGLNVSDYYKSLSTAQYLAGRAQMAALVASELQPDYLSLGAEPDTEAQISGQSMLNSPGGFAGMISNIVKTVRAAAPGIPLGAGTGTWVRDAPDYVSSLAGTGLDYIDLHIYPVNFQFLNSAISLADLAHTLGKDVAISEAWLLKERDSEFTTVDVASNPKIFARDAFSFWAPLDQEFLAGLTRFAYWKELKFASAFWTKYFWAYLDYNQVSGLSATQIVAQSSSASSSALQNGQVTGTGTFYRDALSVSGPPVTALSGASFQPFAVAPGSIISLFGANLASGAPVHASSIPLPTQLMGTSVTFTDSNGTSKPARFFYSSAQQLNVLVDPGVAVGPAVITVADSKGTLATGVITVTAAAPALFSANANGTGVAAANVVTVSANGSKTASNAFQCGSSGCSPVPIILGSGSDQVILILYGTGFASKNASQVMVNIGGVSVAPQYAGPQGFFQGLQQVNVAIPHSLAGRGQVNVQVTAGGVTSKAVTIALQ